MDARLARIEERQISHSRLMEDFIAEQKEVNKLFWQTRNAVIIMEAKKQGAFWVFGIFGSLTLTTAAAGAWLFEQRHVIMNWFKGG